MKNLSFLIIITLGYLTLNAQHTNVFLGNNYSSNFNPLIYSLGTDHHTSFKPILKSDLNFNMDSIIKSKTRSDYSNWFSKKLFSEDLLVLKGDGYRVVASPIINLSIGKDLNDSTNTFTNTRGFIVEGDLGKQISFFSSFLESQSVFPNYVDAFVRKNKVVPGQGYARDFKVTGFDYAMASGYVSYRPNKMFAVQFGHGKHFIGDGYRSLLLSDNTFNYPYLRIQTTFGKFQYTNLYAEFQDINYFLNNNLANNDQIGFPKKYMSAHYLSINATKRLNISFFESVIWRMNHAPGNTGFDINYLNPITILRAAEFSINSPDNVLVGMNLKYKLSTSSYLYGQFILDEFSLTELRKGDDFWGNKFGYQLGYKNFHFLNIDNLTIQSEYNLVRPYTYAHHNPQQNYAHYNQSLAHPLGANFSETLVLIDYKKGRWGIEGKLIFAKYGADIKGDPTSYGSDVYMSTGNFAEESGLEGIGIGRPSDFGIKMYQGVLTTVNIKSGTVFYVLNPRTNLKLNLGVIFRDFLSENEVLHTQFVSFGIMSDLFNRYYDF
tara:strand:+ start:4212 stop:5858 length:1647 start_codon:yes stop_codon:yes gene_type:complete